MGIKDWPEQERPREKLLSRGAPALSDAELLAIFLRSGTARHDAVSLARLLLRRSGSLQALFNASQAEFCDLPGLGTASFVQLQAVMEMSRRVLAEELSRPDALCSPRASEKFLCAQLRGLQHEVFAAMFLDTRHRMIAFEELFRGTIDGASVFPREVVKTALAHNAAAVIFAHNHPSGVAEPSAADRAITERLRDALSLVDIRTLDHIIVAGRDSVSFAERGML